LELALTKGVLIVETPLPLLPPTSSWGQDPKAMSIPVNKRVQGSFSDPAAN